MNRHYQPKHKVGDLVLGRDKDNTPGLGIITGLRYRGCYNIEWYNDNPLLKGFFCEERYLDNYKHELKKYVETEMLDHYMRTQYDPPSR